ncbi:MAG TPA: carboxyl transferase domain-containing protein, partial [Ramlibacter sp.]|nr:carboxyl transferase domain-containing protein [Ramlibacter sp.]
DVVIMVRGRSRAFLAGPPLLKAATGEIATEEELGGAEMHTSISGLGEYLAEDDRHALGIARDVVERLSPRTRSGVVGDGKNARPPSPTIPGQARDDILGLIPTSLREPIDMREVIIRLADGADMLEFKPLYGAATICAQGRIAGHNVGFITNNGPIDVAGANKATHFIQWMCQLGHPIVYLQNTTGYIVGKESEQDGMIKHGSKMIQAVTNATVPQLTIQCGASFGAGNYGMCGRGYDPRFLFSWPSAKTAVMGGEQAAQTMQIVTEAALARKGIMPDPAESKKQFDRIVAMFEAQADPFYTSGLMLDDGVIDPRDTRDVLAFCLDTLAEAKDKTAHPMQFGVARM